MKKYKKILRDLGITLLLQAVGFSVCLLLQEWSNSSELIPAVFVLSAFATAALTDGYVFGILSSIVSVFAVNFAFTFPYFKFSFTLKENIISAVIMLFITSVTSALTTKIKRQKSLEVESEKERMRANLLRAVSHDLRTPLTTICGASSLLIEKKDTFTEEKKDKMLKEIKEDSEWLCQIVENLLSITKLNQGNVKILKSPTVLDELLDSVLLKFKKRHPDMKVRIDIPDEFISIPMDPVLIEQVILNILENAVQHAVGLSFIEIKVTQNQGKALFEISDDGCGIPEEKLPHLFSGYFEARKDENSDSKNKNAGIGLSVCSSIIKAHGSVIVAKNRKPCGATFKFVLDMEDASSDY